MKEKAGHATHKCKAVHPQWGNGFELWMLSLETLKSINLVIGKINGYHKDINFENIFIKFLWKKK